MMATFYYCGWIRNDRLHENEQPVQRQQRPDGITNEQSQKKKQKSMDSPQQARRHDRQQTQYPSSALKDPALESRRKQLRAALASKRYLSSEIDRLAQAQSKCELQKALVLQAVMASTCGKSICTQTGSCSTDSTTDGTTIALSSSCANDVATDCVPSQTASMVTVDEELNQVSCEEIKEENPCYWRNRLNRFGRPMLSPPQDTLLNKAKCRFMTGRRRLGSNQEDSSEVDPDLERAKERFRKRLWCKEAYS